MSPVQHQGTRLDHERLSWCQGLVRQRVAPKQVAMPAAHPIPSYHRYGVFGVSAINDDHCGSAVQLAK